MNPPKEINQIIMTWYSIDNMYDGIYKQKAKELNHS